MSSKTRSELSTKRSWLDHLFPHLLFWVIFPVFGLLGFFIFDLFGMDIGAEFNRRDYVGATFVGGIIVVFVIVAAISICLTWFTVKEVRRWGESKQSVST